MVFFSLVAVVSAGFALAGRPLFAFVLAAVLVFAVAFLAGALAALEAVLTSRWADFLAR